MQRISNNKTRKQTIAEPAPRDASRSDTSYPRRPTPTTGSIHHKQSPSAPVPTPLSIRIPHRPYFSLSRSRVPTDSVLRATSPLTALTNGVPRTDPVLHEEGLAVVFDLHGHEAAAVSAEGDERLVVGRVGHVEAAGGQQVLDERLQTGHHGSHHLLNLLVQGAARHCKHRRGSGGEGGTRDRELVNVRHQTVHISKSIDCTIQCSQIS